MNEKKLTVKCPHCKEKFSYYSSEFRPFCTQRCKMVDMGHWFDESYAIAGRTNSVYIEDPDALQGLMEAQMKITKKVLDDTLKFMQDIAFEAGEIILKYQKARQGMNITNKGDEGIASEADLASERFLIHEIMTKYPGHKILSEEDYSAHKGKKKPRLNSEDFTWVIDPLDGTNNFVNGIPIYAISIALVQKGKTLAGVVYNPLSGECFFAAASLGAFLIDFRINPLKKYELVNKQNKKQMNDCIFSPSPVYEIGPKFERQISTFRKYCRCESGRRLGCASMELCYVANGNFDGYWEKNLRPWDVAAAWLICSEAGIEVTDFDGGKYNLEKDSIFAAANPLHAKILGQITK